MTVIALDGPAGAGKTTVAVALAERLGVPHVDTGAYYRAATLAVLRAGVDPADADRVREVVERAVISRRGGRTYLASEDVEDEIRGSIVTRWVSVVAAHPAVRDILVGLQRRDVAAHGAVVEGRDAGTAVVPDADLKVWVTAPVAVRAVRRASQVGESGVDAIAAHAEAIAARDAADARQMARADGVVEVETQERSVEDVVSAIVALLPDGVSKRRGSS